MEDFVKLGDRIRALLKNQRKTVIELAEYLGKSQSTIYHILNNRISPDIESALKIADFFNISLDELVGRERMFARGIIDESIRKMIEKEAERIIREKFPPAKKSAKKRRR
ncbi:MAG: helix-turn-helix domain-containing protein [Caldiserica bacterium]|nr:helix-turn-helix domain-containing protein [Caldisericota bacterium]